MASEASLQQQPAATTGPLLPSAKPSLVAAVKALLTPGELGCDLWRSWVYNHGDDCHNDPDDYSAEYLLGFLNDLKRASDDNHAYGVEGRGHLPANNSPGPLAGPSTKRRRTMVACMDGARTQLLVGLRAIDMPDEEAREVAASFDGKEEELLAELAQCDRECKEMMEDLLTPSQSVPLPPQQQQLAHARQPTASLVAPAATLAAEQSTQTPQGCVGSLHEAGCTNCVPGRCSSSLLHGVGSAQIGHVNTFG